MLADRGIEDEVHAAIADHGLIVLNMPALGATGPYRDMPGYGILMEGMGGFAARYGTRDEGARATATYYPDLVAGLHGTVAALSALAHRSVTGEGRLVDLSQQEVTWLQLAEAIALHSSAGREVERLGDAEPGCVPSGYYPTEDGRWLALVVRDDAERAVLESVLGTPVDGRDRGRADAAVTAWTSARSLIEALTLLQTAGVRAVVGRTYDDVYRGGDLEARGMVERLVHPLTGDRAYVCLPVRIDGDRWASRRPAARFAEHTDAVLRDWLAIDDERLADLRAREVVGTVPRRRNRR
jgi:crotonobetainyl-CoA:carnitine CoA-transferase CaiB-like acyl-CoA transferase